MIVLFMY
jgi:hypothetical protein